MKLFRIKAMRVGNHVNTTRFATSLSKAKRKARDLKGVIEIAEIQVKGGLTLTDWVDLLEADSPGDQEILRTPVDFMTNIKVVWES